MKSPAEDDHAARATEADRSRPGPVAVGLRLLLPVVLLALGIGGYARLAEKPEAAPPRERKPRVVDVRVEELVRQDYRIEIEAQGAIRAHSRVPITSQVAGRVLAVHPGFEEGAFFREGDILLELDPTDFQLAVKAADVQVAEAEVSLQQEKLRSDQARLDWKDLGYEEEPNDFVLRLPQVQLAEKNLERAEVQLEGARRSLERSKVRAPFDGRVLTRSVGVGQTIGGSAPLGEVFATDYSEVRLAVSTRYLSDLALPEDDPDPPLPIRLRNALAEGGDLEWEAQILRTEGALDERTLELFAIARIEDPFGLHSDKVPLRIGQPVMADIPGRLMEDVFVIPREAISGLDRIRLVDPETLILGSAQVEALWSDEEQVVFRDPGIPDGTLLVLNRLIYAPDGGKVEIIDDEFPLDPTEAAASVQVGADKETRVE